MTNPHKLSLTEAISVIQDTLPQWMRGEPFLKEGSEKSFIQFMGPYKVIRLATGGESRWEHWMEDLSHTYFASRFWEATYRGGGYEYFIPEKALEENEVTDWLRYFGQNPNHAPEFFIGEDEEWAPVTRTSMERRSTDPVRRVQDALFAHLDSLVGEVGVEALAEAVRAANTAGTGSVSDGIEAGAFRGRVDGTDARTYLSLVLSLPFETEEAREAKRERDEATVKFLEEWERELFKDAGENKDSTMKAAEAETPEE